MNTWRQLRIASPTKDLRGNLLAEFLSRVHETTNLMAWRFSSVSVAVPPHSEAWRAGSGGGTCNPLEPLWQRPAGSQRQFCCYTSHFLFAVVSSFFTVRLALTGKQVSLTRG